MTLKTSMRLMIALGWFIGAQSNRSHAQAVIWSSGTGHNDHIYAAFAVPAGGIAWSNAEALAMSVGGHLASTTSSEENAFVFSLVSASESFWTNEPTTGRGIGAWLGGVQATNSPEPAGGWSWSDGGVFSYSNWAPGEPSNGVGSPGNAGLGIEDRIHFFDFSANRTDSRWNDYPNNPQSPQIRPVSFIIEMDRPSLTISRSVASNEVSLSWIAGLTNYSLEGTATLGPLVSWTSITNIPVVSGVKQTVTFPALSGASYFRLRRTN